MKLRNLLFGTMIACAFVACSNDDDPTPNPTPEGDGGVAEVMVNPDLLQGNLSSKALTKAVVDATVYDNYIVYVFDKTGKNIGYGKPGEVFKVTNNPGAVDVMVVGNVGDLFSGSESKTDVLAKTKTFDDKEEAGESLKDDNSIETTSQNSHLYNFILQSELINKIGYADAGAGEVILSQNKIQVYRNVAKIMLKSIKTAEKEVKVTDDEGNTTVIIYPEPKLDVKEVYILNAQYTTKLAAAERWGTVFTEGVVMGAVTLDQYNEWLADAKKAKDENSDIKVLVPTDSKDKGTYKEHTTYLNKNFAGLVTASGTTYTENNSFYTYESTNIASNPTLLVVKGDFSYKAPADQKADKDGRVSEEGYYTVVLGENVTVDGLNKDLFPNASASMGVRRNVQYAINLTVMAPGSKNPLYPNPKVASVEALVDLVGYGEVDSDHTFE